MRCFRSRRRLFPILVPFANGLFLSFFSRLAACPSVCVCFTLQKRKGGADAGSSLQRGPAKRGVSDERSPQPLPDAESGIEAGEQTQRTASGGLARRREKERPEKAAWAEQKGAESGREKAEAESESYLSEAPTGFTDIGCFRWVPPERKPRHHPPRGV